MTNRTIRQAPCRTVALVPAAGRGLRMGSHVAKQFLTLGGQPVLVHTLRVLEAAGQIDGIILAVPEGDREFCLTEIVSRHGLNKVTTIVAGVEQRQAYVRR